MDRHEALEAYVVLTKLMMSMNHPLSSRHNTTFTTPQLYTLVKLHECGEMNLSQVAQIIMVSNQAMTGITNKLVSDGYIERIENDNYVGQRVVLKCGDYQIIYHSIDDIVVSEGQNIKQGNILGVCSDNE